jgi:hypothetical protein
MPLETSELRVGETYRGPLDHNRGLGGVRTIFDIDGTIVLFRVEAGSNPPVCYISHASMRTDDFAAWADECLSTEPST